MYRTRRNFGIATASRQMATSSGISEKVWETVTRANAQLTFEDCDPNIVALLNRMQAIVDSTDPAKTSVPVWYYNAQNPLDGSWFRDIDKKEGEKNDSTGVMWGMIHGAQSISRMLKWHAILNFIGEISVYMRALPCQNPSNDPNFLKDETAYLNGLLDTVEGGRYCLNPNNGPYPELNLVTTAGTIKNVVAIDENTREPYYMDCKGPISWGLTKDRVKAQYFSFPWGPHQYDGRTQRRRDRARGALSWYRSKASDVVDMITAQRGVAQNRVNAVPALLNYEKEMDVNADFKVELTEPFRNVAREKLEETIDIPNALDEGGYEETADYSFIYKIAAGVFGVAGGMIAGKAIAERMK